MTRIAAAGLSPAPPTDSWRARLGALVRQPATSSPGDTDRYRLADGMLEIDSDDDALRDRFRVIYRECMSADEPASPLPTVRLTLRLVDHGVALATFEDPGTLDAAAFALALFDGRGYDALPDERPFDGLDSGPAGVRYVTAPGVAAPALAFSGNRVAVRLDSAWRPFLANLAVNRLLRLQTEVLFLHAASVSVGLRGALLCGPKLAGKTTLALAIAARGHALLGDEIAAVRGEPATLLPFRRALSVREGPGARAVRTAMRGLGDDGTARVERYPDGSLRTRAYPSELFPAAAGAEVPLAGIFVLGAFGTEPRVRRLQPSRDLLGALTPLRASLWGAAAPVRAASLLRLVTRVPCFALEAGTPDDTADLVARTLEMT